VRRSWLVLTALAVACPLLGGCVVTAGSGRSGAWAGFVFLFFPLFLVLLVTALARAGRGRRPARSVRRDPPHVSSQMLRAELSVLADDVVRLEPQVALKEEARNDFEAATHRYRVAQAALDQADEPVDLGRVQRVVDEATWSMARARAILDGRPLPAPPTTLRRTGNGGEPAVDLDDDDQPVYVGSRAPYSAGWFGVGSGLFGGLLMGSMLGGFGGWVVEDIGEGADREDGSATDW
jgi:hypothetical protein